MMISRRSLLGRTAVSIIASQVTRPAAHAQGRDGTPPIYFPPGSRLGIARPSSLGPETGDPRNLLSGDHTFQVLFTEPPQLGPPYDADIWDRAHDRDRRLVRSETVAPEEDRRLFTMRAFEDGPDHGWRTLIIRKPDWFGQLDVKTQPLNASGVKQRWQSAADAVLASATVRPALGVEDFLREHGIALGAAGLHPRHFGSKLIMSLRAPASPREAWTGDCYIAMESPIRMPFPWSKPQTPAQRDAFVAEHRAIMASNTAWGPWRSWRSHDIDWLAEAEHSLPGTALFVRELTGFGRSRMIKLQAYCQSADQAPTMAAIERVARSVVLDP